MVPPGQPLALCRVMPDFAHEQRYEGSVAGVDEAGRGPWAGPVVAAAVILSPGAVPAGINDSKALSASKREAIYQAIMAQCDVGVGVVEAEVIDRINILEATKQAMQQAVSGLAICPQVALVDGNQPPQLPCEVVPVIRGDAASLSIAAASIVAKVTRDRMMQTLHHQFPAYGWANNAGYGTKQHREAIALHGVTPHHRKSFKPVRLHLEQGGNYVEA